VEGQVDGLPLGLALIKGEFDGLPLGSTLSEAVLKKLREAWQLVEGELELKGMPIRPAVTDREKLVEGQLDGLPLGLALIEGVFDGLLLGSALSVPDG
jgi:acetyl-CoA carboxylase beta subunit